jgi:hypothetical protein
VQTLAAEHLVARSAHAICPVAPSPWSHQREDHAVVLEQARGERL